jgi:HAD superfamily hydrolase (TIGR01509 family)
VVQRIDPTLVRDVDLLCLDAGNTVVFIDHERLARACGRFGFATTAEALVRAEGDAKHALERGEEVAVGWTQSHVASAQGWGCLVGTMLHHAGIESERLGRALGALWSEHRVLNFWSLVVEGLVPALDRLRALGMPVAVVSNSEGKLEELFHTLGILSAFDLVIDSGVIGVEKPDPRIFRIALDRFGVPPARALHLGDTFGPDVLGARAAGLRVALVDPHGHLAGRHPDVPRVSGVPEVARAIAEMRGGRDPGRGRLGVG